MNQIWQQYRFHILIMIALLCAFPLLSLFQRTMFWDMTLINLPWRYHLSECLNHRELPLWNPWMNSGFPQMAHYETWYPVSWFIALVFGYNIDSLQYEFLFHLLMAGIGFYKLTSLFNGVDRSARAIAAISYMLCGVFVAQASQLGYITSGAWMPFVFFYLITFLHKPGFENGIYLSFFYFLLITGGYPGNFIAITYLCVGITVLYIGRKILQKKYENLKRLLVYVPIFGVLVLLMYAVVLVPSIELQDYVTRTKLEYTNTGFGAMTGSTSLNGYLTLITPSAACSKNEFWGEYFMLNDVYFGLFSFLVVLYFLVRAKQSQYYKLAWLFFISALIFMMISVATVFPVHHWLYKMIPLFDRFRFPSLFRIFFVMQFIFISLFAWQWLRENEGARKEFGWMILGVLILAVTGLLFLNPTNFSIRLFTSDFDRHVLALNQSGLLLIDFVLIIILGLLWLIFSKMRGLNFLTVALILLIADLSFHTWIRSPRFVSSDKNPSEIANLIREIPRGFSLIDQTTVMGDAHKKFKPIDGLWLNTFSYYKYPMPEGSSPYSTVMYRDAIRTGAAERMRSLPLIAVFDKIDGNKLDTSYYNQMLSETIISLRASPNGFKFKVKNCAGKKLIFNHNYYPHWNFYEDGKKLETQLVDGNYYAFQLHENDADLDIRFEPKAVYKAFYVSASAFMLTLLCMVSLAIRKLLYKRRSKALNL